MYETRAVIIFPNCWSNRFLPACSLPIESDHICPSLSVTMPIDLTSVSVDDLLKEVSRRLECTKKPERRMILIGESAR